MSPRIQYVACAAGFLLALIGAGCGSGRSQVQDEFAEQVEIAKQHAGERRVARRRAMPIEHAMRPKIRVVDLPTDGCRARFTPIRPRAGIVPIACGNLGSAAWPLTVQRGYLRCESEGGQIGRRVIFTAPGGAEYALNSNARGVGYTAIKDIQKTTTSHGPADLAPLANRGLRLC